MTADKKAAVEAFGWSDNPPTEVQERVAKALEANGPLVLDHERLRKEAISSQIANMSKPAKKPRSDKGKPRKAAPEQPGALSPIQASRGLDLLQTRDNRRTEWDMAQTNECDAKQRFEDADAAVLAWFRENTAK